MSIVNTNNRICVLVSNLNRRGLTANGYLHSERATNAWGLTPRSISKLQSSQTPGSHHQRSSHHSNQRSPPRSASITFITQTARFQMEKLTSELNSPTDSHPISETPHWSNKARSTSNMSPGVLLRFLQASARLAIRARVRGTRRSRRCGGCTQPIGGGQLKISPRCTRIRVHVPPWSAKPQQRKPPGTRVLYSPVAYRSGTSRATGWDT